MCLLVSRLYNEIGRKLVERANKTGGLFVHKDPKGVMKAMDFKINHNAASVSAFDANLYAYRMDKVDIIFRAIHFSDSKCTCSRD